MKMVLEKKLDEKRVIELKQKLLDTLQYRPNAMIAYTIQEKIGGDYSQEEYSEASAQLQKEERIFCINGWWTRGRRPVSDSERTTRNDDLDYLLGIGRYGQ